MAGNVNSVHVVTMHVRVRRMREVELGDDGKALLVHQNGAWSAVGSKCTHYGAPLAKGCLGDGRVRCPWHGACFNVGTGDIEDFPGLDSLPAFQVAADMKPELHSLKPTHMPTCR